MTATMHYNLGTQLFHAGQYEAALGEIDQSLRLRPDYAPAHHLLAVTFMMQGRYKEALPPLVETLRLKPDWDAAQQNYAIAIGRSSENH